MPMHGTLRQAQAGSLIEDMAAAFAITPAQAGAMMRVVAPELTWHLQKNTLSRGGLADVVEALGSTRDETYFSAGDAFHSEAVRADGNAVLGRLLGSKDASRTLAARAARRTGLEAAQIAAMLPFLAGTVMSELARRTEISLKHVLAELPPLGRLSRDEPYADLADILRRRCGAGAYSPRALPRVTRQGLAEAAGFANHGVLIWYARFMVVRIGTRWAQALAVGRPRAQQTGPEKH